MKKMRLLTVFYLKVGRYVRYLKFTLIDFLIIHQYSSAHDLINHSFRL